MKKAIIGVVILVLVVIAGVWWYMSSSQAGAPGASQEVSGSQTPAAAEPNSVPPTPGTVQQQNPNTTTGASQGTQAAVQGDSDATLNQDLNTIDAQLSGLGSDASNANTAGKQ